MTLPLTGVPIQRPKLSQTLTETFAINAAIAGDDTTDTIIVDIFTQITKDDDSTANKTLARIKMPSNFQGAGWATGATILLFPGDAPNYVAGGVTPPDSEAVGSPVSIASAYLDLDAFLTAAGDTRKNS
jgi:hypothetical protein